MATLSTENHKLQVWPSSNKATSSTENFDFNIKPPAQVKLAKMPLARAIFIKNRRENLGRNVESHTQDLARRGRIHKEEKEESKELWKNAVHEMNDQYLEEERQRNIEESRQKRLLIRNRTWDWRIPPTIPVIPKTFIFSPSTFIFSRCISEAKTQLGSTAWDKYNYYPNMQNRFIFIVDSICGFPVAFEKKPDFLLSSFLRVPRKIPSSIEMSTPSSEYQKVEKQLRSLVRQKQRETATENLNAAILNGYEVVEKSRVENLDDSKSSCDKGFNDYSEIVERGKGEFWKDRMRGQ